MFDLERAKSESHLPPSSLVLVEEKVRAEFEGDEMMFELHLVRVLGAIKEGWVTLEEALAESIAA